MTPPSTGRRRDSPTPAWPRRFRGQSGPPKYAVGYFDPAMYEDIYRIHCLARLPAAAGGIPGRRDGHFVSLVDLPATWLDAAGVPVPGEYDGRSLLPLLR